MTTKKQTSDRVSRIAARLLRNIQRHGLEAPMKIFGCSLPELAALAASALSQDETKCKKRRARK